jgi:hypothetical protein
MTFSRRLTLKKGNAGRPFSNRRPQNQIFRKFRALLAARHGGFIKHQRYIEGVERFFVIAVPLEACVQNLALLGICALFLAMPIRRRVHRREWRRRQRGGLPYHGDRPVQNELPAREKAASDEARPPDSGLRELTLPLSIRKKVPLPFA